MNEWEREREEWACKRESISFQWRSVWAAGKVALRLAWWGGGGGRVLAGHLKLRHIQSLVDDLWHGLDLSVELLLNAHEAEAIVVCEEVDGKAQVPEPPRATYSMQVRLRRLGEVEVDDDIDGLNVDASSE